MSGELNLIASLPPWGFSCCPLGGHGWGKVDEEQLVPALRPRVDVGVRLFDTADVLRFSLDPSTCVRLARLREPFGTPGSGR